MKCPNCGQHDMAYVVDSRRKDGGYIIRRHKCECGHKFNTIEVMELNEKTLSAIHTAMRNNSGPRAYEKAISNEYDKLFHFRKYKTDKRAGNVI